MSYAAGQRVSYKGMEMPAKVISGPHKTVGADRYLIEKADGNVSLVHHRELTALPSRRETLALAMYNAQQRTAFRSFAEIPQALSRDTYLRLADAALTTLRDVLAPEDAEGGFWVAMTPAEVGTVYAVLGHAVSGPEGGPRQYTTTTAKKLAPLIGSDTKAQDAYVRAQKRMARRAGGLGVHFSA